MSSMKKIWIITITVAVALILMLILIRLELFDAWTFGGMLFYVLVFLGGYAFVAIGKIREQKRLEEQASVKQKFDFCWSRVNLILRRLPGGQGLEWSGGFGRKSEFRTYHDGIQNRPFRSMLGFLSNTQQLAIIIYDIERDDIVRFVTNPDPDILENHYKNFRPFSRGSAMGEDYDGMYQRGYGAPMIHSRRYGNRAPISINVGGEYDDDRMTSKDMRAPRPDDDMVESAVKKVRE